MCNKKDRDFHFQRGRASVLRELREKFTRHASFYEEEHSCTSASIDLDELENKSKAQEYGFNRGRYEVSSIVVDDIKEMYNEELDKLWCDSLKKTDE